MLWNLHFEAMHLFFGYLGFFLHISDTQESEEI